MVMRYPLSTNSNQCIEQHCIECVYTGCIQTNIYSL